ncbi:MAG: PilZ domain-containing protein [Syntrophales bacterium]
MEDKKTRQPVLIDIGKVRKAPDEPFLPLWFFQHDDLVNAIDAGSRIKKENLINTLNRIHFMGDSVCVLLRHPKYDEAILVKAIPETTEKDELKCSWDKSHTSFGLENFQFSYLIVMDQQSIILIPAKLLGIDSAGFKVQLPEESYLISKRVTNRFPCRDVTAELTQSGFLARGSLVDFSPQSFRIKVRPEMPSSYHEFNPDATVTIRLTGDGKMLFSGNCRCLRQTYEIHDWEIVLAPLSEQIKRFQTRTVRHPRRRIFPPPMAVFEHPFFRRKFQREITDISITGFSMYDDAIEGILLPGMIIHGLSIIYAGELKMNCAAQVIYRKRPEDNKACCGLAILDMDIHSYSRLNRIISLNMDHHSFISTEVDMDALWEFFFDTGFIYPNKYKLLHDRREDFKNTYRKLYQENPEIAMHFTYEENGRIYGHMSMLRAYERTWLIHHHAARPMQNKLPGVQILKHMMLFLYGMYHLPSAKMDYVMCFFRPENKFPDRVFGGFARELKNPHICSLDLFSYMTFPIGTPQYELPRGWSLHESTPSELWQLEQFLKHSSGGFLFDVLSLGKKDPTDDSLEKVSQRLGFTRKWTVYSLNEGNNLKAVLIVNQSDVGVNLSELLNSIKALIVDSENLPWEVLSAAVAQLTGVYHLDSIPLLIYPSAYSEVMNIPTEKKYQLWITNMRHSNKFMEYVQRHFRMKYE